MHFQDREAAEQADAFDRAAGIEHLVGIARRERGIGLDRAGLFGRQFLQRDNIDVGAAQERGDRLKIMIGYFQIPG